MQLRTLTFNLFATSSAQKFVSRQTSDARKLIAFTSGTSRAAYAVPYHALSHSDLKLHLVASFTSQGIVLVSPVFEKDRNTSLATTT